MTNLELQIKVKERINKLDSMDYDNFECWQIVEAFNKGQYRWIRKQVHGYNIRKQGDEASKFSIDDLEPLLIEVPLTVTEQDRYYETQEIPNNYLYWKRVKAQCVVECCDDRYLKIHLAEIANDEDLLDDEFKKPSADWGETFAGMMGRRIRIYTNNEFGISNTQLIYYREPVRVQILGCMNLQTGVESTIDTPCEFKNDIAEILVDECVAILSGDIESMNQYSISKQDTIENS